MRISLFHLARHPCSLIFATVFLVVAALPVHPQPPSKAPQEGDLSQRETIDFEGMRIVFPKGEADVVELLKPALRKYREERGRAAEAEAKEIGAAFSDSEVKDMLRKAVAAFVARDSVGSEFDTRWAAQATSLQALADAWRDWSGDLSELQLWRQEELAPFQTRPDGSDDAEGFCYRFPQISFGKKGSHFALHPPFLAPLFGLDMMLKVRKVTKPLRLDLPLLYKAGETPQEIAKYDLSFLEELPPFLHREQATGSIPTSLPVWSLEYLLLGEVEEKVVERRTVQETALADGIARILLFAQVLKMDGQEKTAKEFPRLFPFAIGGWDLSDPEAILSTLEKLDPLGKVDRANVTERIFARNLIALALLDLAQKDDTQSPILHKFKKAGVEIPAGGFTMDSFCAAVDAAYGEKDVFRRTVAARKGRSLDELRQSAAKHKEDVAKNTGNGSANTAPVPAPPPNRESKKFGELTITYPPELKEAVEIVGPEYAKLLASARASIEALCKKSLAPAAAEEVDVSADMDALRAYGIEPNANVIREFAVVLDVLRDGTQIFRWFFSGNRMQIWIKEDLLSLLKSGASLPDFTLTPDGGNVSWNIPFFIKNQIPDASETVSTSPSEVRAKVLKRIDTIPHPVFPILVKRGSLPKDLDDRESAAAAVRKGEIEIFSALHEAAASSEGASQNAAAFSQMFSREQAWFMVAHEVTEGGVVTSVIKSADRRWFCDGLANWVAMQDVDRRFGPGKGAEAFAKSYNAAELRKHAAEVDLLAWPTAEEVQNGSRHDVDDPNAYYYFATLVIEKACAGRGADFVKEWLDEIRKTPLNRANAGTVLAAYRKLTGKDLKSMIGEVVKAE